MTNEPHPEHARARSLMDKLAKAAGMPSGQALISHLETVPTDAPALKLIGEAIDMSLQRLRPTTAEDMNG
jgi:hypothetical protein